MRVIAGDAGGLVLVAPRGSATRPTTDKVKGAIFGMLGEAGAAGRVLDLFAGSGGLGIEALSRGATWCDFVDRSPDAIAAIVANLAHTHQAGAGQVHRVEALRFLDGIGTPFDLVLCDPPYGWVAMDDLLGRLARPEVTRGGGIVVLETGRRDPAPSPPARLVVDRTRIHGDTVVTIMRASG